MLAALRRVPRHVFVPPGSRGAAYEDHPLGIGHGQTMSQPYIVAFMTELLELRGTERVLEIGTGSGYQSAVLAELCALVYSVERIGELADRARAALRDLGSPPCPGAHRRRQRGVARAGAFRPDPGDRCGAGGAGGAPRAGRGQRRDRRPGRRHGGRRSWSSFGKIGSRVSIRESIGCRFVPLLGSGGFEA